MASARDQVLAAETRAALLPGVNERFSGWGIMGLPFRSGDVLATRRFPASSIGPGYTSVWYRNPAGEWTFYADVPPETACTRFFGSAVARAVVCPIVLEWTGEDRLHVEVPEDGLACDIVVGPTLASRAMNLVSAAFPEWAWRNPRALRLTAAMAGPMLGAGKLSMAGTAPNRQAFVANPRRIWVVKAARLRAGGREVNEPGPVTPQAQLGDFRIPQRGILAIGNAGFDALDPALHSTAVSSAGT
ncbi:MAG: hypothetical protein HY875_15200 [Chloroflexi bacterium]|nr:hypothetical protein [Chloroflexota bacterium]